MNLNNTIFYHHLSLLSSALELQETPTSTAIFTGLLEILLPLLVSFFSFLVIYCALFWVMIWKEENVLYEFLMLFTVAYFSLFEFALEKEEVGIWGTWIVKEFMKCGFMKNAFFLWILFLVIFFILTRLWCLTEILRPFEKIIVVGSSHTY